MDEDRDKGRDRVTMASTAPQAAPMAGGEEGPSMATATAQAEVHLYPLQAGWEDRDRVRV